MIPSFTKTGIPIGGPVLHSCDDFSTKIESVKEMEELKMVDATFSNETDPDPNEPEPFANGFSHSGIVLNARIVGNLETIEQQVRKLWKPGLKLAVVPYCQTPEEQSEAYDMIHEICPS